MLLAQDYMPMWALVSFLMLLGVLSVAVPRFRRYELEAADPKDKKKKKGSKKGR